MKKTFFTLIALTLSLFLGVSKTQALGITPFIFEMEGEPGQVIEKSITVHNDSGRDAKVEVLLQDFEALDDTGRQRFIPNEEEGVENSMYKWLSEFPNFSLAVDETRVIDFSVTIPEDAATGGRYAAIIFHQKANSGEGKAVSSAIASLILLTVNGPDIDADGRIVSFQATQNEAGETVFETVVKNTGNVHIKPIGHIRVGEDEIPFNDTLSNVLPGQSRRFETVWKEPLDSSTVQAEIQAKVGYLTERQELGYVEDSNSFVEKEKEIEVAQNIVPESPISQQVTYYVLGALFVITLLYFTFRSTSKK